MDLFHSLLRARTIQSVSLSCLCRRCVGALIGREPCCSCRLSRCCLQLPLSLLCLVSFRLLALLSNALRRSVDATDDVDVDVDQLDASSKKSASARPQRMCSLVIGLACLVCAGIGTFVVLDSQDFVWPFSKDGLNDAEPAQLREAPIGATELALYDNPKGECWIAFHGVVYNVTSYIPRHPGGPSYLESRCGTDGTAGYQEHHPVRLLKVISDLQLAEYDEAAIMAQPTAATPSDVNER
mmetsp:Transcript_17554/g.49560  ORF Transcript_17554/g.49560 Transcript_17554/m.49560 type:complete len:240 (-) Transcript_17554:832-1551(-)